jgi:hypothetical protein
MHNPRQCFSSQLRNEEEEEEDLETTKKKRERKTKKRKLSYLYSDVTKF